MNPRIVRTIGAIACVALIATIVGLFAVSLADGLAYGGYRAERYVGRFDPFRAAILAAIAPGCVIIAVFAFGTISAWRSKPRRASHAAALSSIGWLIAFMSLPVIVLAYPVGVGSWAIPTPLAAPLLVGVGLGTAGALPQVATALADAIRRRDRGLIVGLALLVAWLTIVILRRR